MLTLLYVQIASFIGIAILFGFRFQTELFTTLAGMAFIAITLGWFSTAAVAYVAVMRYKKVKRFGATVTFGLALGIVPFLPVLLVVIAPGTSTALGAFALLTTFSFIPALATFAVALTSLHQAAKQA